ncbi:hypothetical protein ACLKA6_015016 [Drosophila palustris]
MRYKYRVSHSRVRSIVAIRTGLLMTLIFVGAGPLACSSCPPHFMLDGGLCMECLSSQYYDTTTQTCKICHESCHSCFGPGQFSCKACVPPLHLDRLNSQCVPCCQAKSQGETTDGRDVDADATATAVEDHCCHCDAVLGECKSASTGGKRRTVVGTDSIFRNAIRDRKLEMSNDGNSGAFVFRLDSPLTAITAIAVAICLLIITIFSIIFAVLQRNSNHISRNSVRYRKINGRKCDAGNEARFIFNVGENGDDTDDNTDDDQDDLDVNTMRSNNKRIVYEQQHHNNGNEFFMKSTNDIDAIEFHGSKGVNCNNPKMNTDCSIPTYMNPPTSSSNNRRINSRNNVQS